MPSPASQVQLAIVEDVLGELIVLEAPAAQIAIGPQLSDTAPVALGTAAAGTASSAARGDHVHAHGNLAGSSLHALASTSAAGFMSAAQFDLLAAATDDDDASTLVKRDSLGDFSAGTITANLTGTASAIADNTVTSAKIVDGSIVNADINASAEIAVSKLADGSARQLLQTAANGTDVEWSSNIDVPGTLDVTGAATFDGAVTIQGDLTVNGTETIINTQTLDVEDKNIVIGKVDTPTDTTADGGGITLKGTTDKTINWVDATDAWTFSEHIDLASTKEYRIAGAKVLDATSLGSAVVTSSLTSVGTIGTGTWQGTAIADIYLETIATAGKVSNSATTADSANTASAIVARDASGNFSAGTITAALTGNADTATKLSSTRTFAVTGDITGTVSSDLTGGASITTAIAAGVVVNADINASAAIAHSKLANITAGQVLLGNASNVPTATALTGDVTVNNTGVTAISAGVIVDADVNASAAIAGTKINPNFGTQTVDTSGLASLSGLMLAFAQRGASIGIPGQPLFGVGPAVTSTTPVGIGPHDYYPIDLFSGSFM
jgi:cytoskeletal protein CcmA (bactofilin family)